MRSVSSRLLISLLVIASVTVWAAYESIPKAIEDITGPEDNAEIYIGESISPEYTIEPYWFKNETISFHTNDDNVITVDDKGVIQAVAPGETTLTVSAKDYSEQIRIAVIPKVTKITGIEKSIAMTTGDVSGKDNT